ncbi:MAG: lipid IV(A) 3-deoxy-D-manno-octulosonic acid transferase [Gammaproteobacteria bacterium]
MRFLYTALFTLAIPFVLLRLVWRGFKAHDYWRRWNERFGRYSGEHPRGVVWFHAVSVGEAEAAFPLVKFLLHRFPERKVLVTTTTPTGSARVRAVLGDTVEHVYLPYDIPAVVERFFDHFKPCMAVILETEIWPNLYIGCGDRNIPLIMVNARLSEKSAKSYRRISSLVKASLARVHTIAAQTEADARRFVSIGADARKVKVTGNIKFDLELPEDILEKGKRLKQTTFHGRLVWTIASTHKGEEEIFLEIYKKLKENYPDLLLILVPRHPERFAEAKSLCDKHQLQAVMRTRKMPCHDAIDVYIADTMGELKMIYAASDLTFVGGSMAPVGGHNLLEPAALGIPVMFGPHMHNFKDIARGVLEAGAGVQCMDEGEIIGRFAELMADLDKRKSLGEMGRAFVKRNQGALGRVGALLSKVLAAEGQPH